MFDIGWQEFIMVALVAVVVVGPKDLPRVIRTVGQWVRKARSLASEFQSSLEEMAREADLDDVRKQIQQVSKDGVGATIEKHVDPTGGIRKSFEDAKSSAGAEEIESVLNETKQDVKSLADDATAAARTYEELADANRIPDNSVTPPAPTSSETGGAQPDKADAVDARTPKAPTTAKSKPKAKAGNGAAKEAAQSATAPAAKKSTAKAPAKKASPAKPAAAKASTGKAKSEASAKQAAKADEKAAKPRRTPRKAAADAAGEA